MLTKTLVFDIHKDNILNANQSKHFIVKGRIVAFLRTLAATKGLSEHPKETREAVERRLNALTAEHQWEMTKKRARADLGKRQKHLSKKAVEEQVKETHELLRPEVSPGDVDVAYLFERFRITITVSPPTRRRLDAPNLYPTVKALVDGLTDAAFWEDDDFSHMDQMSFRYGGVSGDKNTFRLVLTMEEIEAEGDITSDATRKN